MSGETDLLDDCAEAGVVFHPRGGMLRPKLTRGPISRELKARMTANKERLVMFFAEAFDWYDFEHEVDTSSQPPPLWVLPELSGGRIS